MSLKTIRTSVRNIVEFVLRSGSIDLKYTGSKRAVEGTKIHAKLQKKHFKESLVKGYIYKSEENVSITTEHKNFTFEISGRADGIVEVISGKIPNENDDKDNAAIKKELHIEEIKSTAKNIDSLMPDFDHWHSAQAKFYGYMYAAAENFENIIIHITYCKLGTFEEICFEKEYTIDELKTFFYEILDMYYEWELLAYNFEQIRNKTVKEMSFPHGEYRKGQRELAVAVYKTIVSQKKLFAKAPTGIGKTISTLFPSLKYIAEADLPDTKIFYITAKTITRQAAQNSVKAMEKSGLAIKILTLTAKEKICFLEKPSCSPNTCPYADGHFNRVNDALRALLENKNNMEREDIQIYAEKYKVCPFELSLDAAIFSHLIICDYNYVYNPTAQLKRFFGDDANGKHIILTDEAHNLFDRAVDMYSAALSLSELKNAKKIIYSTERTSPAQKAISKVINFLLKTDYCFEGKNGIKLSHNFPDDLIFLLSEFCISGDGWLTRNAASEVLDYSDYEKVISCYFSIMDFIRISEFFDEHYIVYTEKKNKELIYKLFCTDPSKILSDMQKKHLSTIFFSATLSPIDYFKETLGGSSTDNVVCSVSPFDFKNLCIMSDCGISTKYKFRTESIEKIVDRIYTVINTKCGNYFVFFPSYEYLNNVYDNFVLRYPKIKTAVQPQNMAEAEREQFLKMFLPNPTETFVAFAVMGGIFSEGIDLCGNRLIGSVIVSPGLPLISDERNAMKDYFDKKNGNGFKYMYTYPGFNKVMQSAGRVIRTATDKGVVLLIDSRFELSEYKKLFPMEWQHSIKVKNVNEIKNILENFWEK